jgi:hypothetical protein
MGKIALQNKILIAYRSTADVDITKPILTSKPIYGGNSNSEKA